MNRLEIEKIDFPEVFKEDIKSLSKRFPDGVRFDQDDFSTEFLEKFPLRLSVAVSFFHLTSDFNEVFENLNIIIEDFVELPNRIYDAPRSYERRYHLFTKTFFAELLRVRDAWGRHLKRQEKNGLTDKKERSKTRRLFNEQFEEHYLIRNVYLHGHTVPRSKKEFDLKLMALWHQAGFKPELVPKDGSDVVEFYPVLSELCNRRAEGLFQIGSDVRTFLNEVIRVSGIWSHHKASELEQQCEQSEGQKT